MFKIILLVEKRWFLSRTTRFLSRAYIKYLLVSRHPLSSMRRQTVRLCSECGRILIWLAKIGGTRLCDTTVEVSLLPTKTCRTV